MIPPACRAHLDPIAAGRTAAAPEALHFSNVGDTASAVGKARSEGKGDDAQIVGATDRARLGQRRRVVGCDAAELGLSIADLGSVASSVEDRVDDLLSGEPVAHACGAARSRIDYHISKTNGLRLTGDHRSDSVAYVAGTTVPPEPRSRAKADPARPPVLRDGGSHRRRPGRDRCSGSRVFPRR